ncbi:MAG: hypothetical protein HZB25_02540 [Candidatus Eisenbacteria bacterium]|nr:hypothetical protein [Candidatus Eisenbacteria bacterium]
MIKYTRTLTILALAATLAAAATGCSRRFTEPVQSPRQPYIPPPATFIQVAGWTQPDWNPTCVLLTHSGILLVAEDSARVQNYAALGVNRQAFRVNTYRFDGLVRPVQVSEGGGHIFVADLGDGTRNNPVAIKGFNPALGLDDPMAVQFSVSDTDWVRIKGITADLQRNLYVSCDAKVTVFQPPNPAEVDTQAVIYRYRAPAYTVRDTVAEQGTGIGTVEDAHAIVFGGERIYVADTGKDWAQQLDPIRKNLGYFKVDGSEADTVGTLRGPLGVAVDEGGYFYVVDTGNRRVLRYFQDGRFDQVVNQVGPDGMLGPVSASAGLVQANLYIYVADPLSHRVNVYRFQR